MRPCRVHRHRKPPHWLPRGYGQSVCHHWATDWLFYDYCHSLPLPLHCLQHAPVCLSGVLQWRMWCSGLLQSTARRMLLQERRCKSHPSDCRPHRFCYAYSTLWLEKWNPYSVWFYLSHDEPDFPKKNKLRSLRRSPYSTRGTQNRRRPGFRSLHHILCDVGRPRLARTSYIQVYKSYGVDGFQ